MARRLSELWRISGVVYREAVFQSTFVLRRGGQLGKMRPSDIKNSLKINTWLTKGILTLFLATIAIVAAVSGTQVQSGAAPALVLGSFSSLFMVAILLLITMMAMDMVTGFVSSKAVSTLVLLPLTRRELETTSLLAFLRIFDLPLLVGILSFSLVHLLRTHSTVGTLVYLLATAAAEALAVVAALALAEFFYSKVLRQAGSGLQNLARLLYMLIWLFPSIGIYLFFSFGTGVGRSLVQALSAEPSRAEWLALVYPFSFGFLGAAATGVSGAGNALLARALPAALVQSGLILWGLFWAAGRLRARAAGAGAVSSSRKPALPQDFRLRPTVPWLGVLRKDMRLVFRSPSEMSLFLMPAAATIPMAVSIALKGGGSPFIAAGIMSGIAFFAVLTVPVLFSVETVGSAYSRTLPLRVKWIIGAKTVVVTVIYLVSMSIMIAVILLVWRGRIGWFPAFGLSQALSAAAGALVVCLLLQRRTGRRRRRISPFASPLDYILSMAAGGLAVSLPLIAAGIGTAGGLSPLPVYLVAALIEAGAVALYFKIN